MEKINFKPSIKLEKKILFFGVVIAFALIILSVIGAVLISKSILFSIIFIIGALFILFIGVVISMIVKSFTSYSITSDNKLHEKFEFIVKSSRMYRIDQITSITLKQGFFQKLVGLGSVSYGIFGNDSVIGAGNVQAGNQAGAQNLNLQVFNSIENYEEIFKILSDKINVSESPKISLEKPSLKPVKFWRNVWFLFVFIMIIVIGISYVFISNVDARIIITLLGGFFAFMFLLFGIGSEFSVIKTRSTRYIVTKNSLILMYDYFFGRKVCKVPLSKITNTQVHKNIISYFLFKVGGVRVFTGGDNDPYFEGLEKFESFSKSVVEAYDSYGSSDVKKKSKSLESSGATSIKVKKPQFKTKPRFTFFLGFAFWISIFFGIVVGILMFFNLDIYALGIALIWFISCVLRFILWKNITYEFYEDRLITKGGIINITTKEIHFKNLKYISLTRNFFFERIFSFGSVYLFTAGTGLSENKVSNIKEYDKVFETLSEEILD